MALRDGMSGEEISSFLSGKENFIKSEEAKAIMFGQHFADSGTDQNNTLIIPLKKIMANEKQAFLKVATQKNETLKK